MQLRLALFISVLLLGALLSGCGGGATGGAFDNNPLNAQLACNNQQVNQSTCIPGGSNNSTGSGITTNNGRQVARSVVQLFNKLDAMSAIALELVKQAAQAYQSPSNPVDDSTTVLTQIGDINCTNPGNNANTIEYRYYPNPSSIYNADTFHLNFNNCELNGLVLSGTTILTDIDISLIDPTAIETNNQDWSFFATLDLSTLSAVDSGSNQIDFSGVLEPLEASFDLATAFQQVSFGNSSLNNAVALTYSDNSSDSLSQFFVSITDDNSSGSAVHKWYGVAGTLNSRVTGSEIVLSVDPNRTDGSVTWSSTPDYPDIGRIELDAGSNSNMEIFVSGGAVTLSITDPNVFDPSDPSTTAPVTDKTTWNDLLTGNIF